MPKKNSRQRLRFTLHDKKIIAQYQNQLGLLGNDIRCARCGRELPIDVMEVDHIKPISKRGTDQPSNLRLLCPPCNKRKGAKKIKLQTPRPFIDVRMPTIPMPKI